MIRNILAALMLCIAACASAENAQIKPEANDEHEAIFAELAHRSTLPRNELESLLADCDANQQSIYFCAWRDQITAERKLDSMLTAKLDKMPRCKKAIDGELARWKKQRDSGCEKSATRDYGEGSLKATAQIACVTAEIEKRARQATHSSGCGF